MICSTRDKQGFLWFGTKDGLNRFDGYAFKIFRRNKEDSKSIGNNFIQSLFEDENGILWVGTGAGLFAYDPVKESFSLVKNTSEDPILSIKTDTSGNLWFIAGVTLCKFNRQTGILKKFDPKSFFKASSICLTEDGGLWIASLAGKLEKYDPIHDSFLSHPACLPLVRHDQGKAIETLYSTGNQSILIGTPDQGILLFDITKGSFKEVIAKNQDKTSIYARDFIRVGNDEYWMATESGIFIYHMASGKIINLRKQYNNPYSLTDNAVYTLCQDRQGGMWSGTYFGGTNYYSNQHITFEKSFPRMGENSISGNAVREICRDRSGNLWIGTEDAGLNEIKAGTDTFTHFIPTGRKGSIVYSNIHGLLAAGDTLWVGTFQKGLDRMDTRTGRVIRHYSAGTRAGSFKNDFIYTIFQTRAGVLLIGTGAGLYKYNPKTDDFTPMPFVPGGSFIASIHEDTKGVIRVGTFREGFYFYNPGTGEQGNFRYSSRDVNSLPDNRINGIEEDNHHILWLATEGGFCRYDPEKNTFRAFTTKEGFPSNVIYRSLQDAKGNLWVSTSKGLVCFNPANERWQTYTTFTGLLSDQFNYNSALRDMDNSMYFGSVKGMIRFNPEDYAPTSLSPDIYITGFQVDNKELTVDRKGSPLTNSITHTSRITLDFNQSSFSIDFAALNFAAPEMTKYRYQMLGLDKEWTSLQTNRKVYFTGLAPGNYTFLVKASQTGNIWNESPATLEIRILPPFWRSSLANLFYDATILLTVLLCIRAYHRRVEDKNKGKLAYLENEKEKEIVHAKIEFFTNVAHEIKTPLTLIKLPLEKTLTMADNDSELLHNLKIMERNTDRLIDLTNQLLDFRKTENNGLTLNFVKSDIHDLLAEQFLAFKPAAEQRNINFTLELPKMHLQAYVDIEAIKKILSNLFSNALKYGKDEVHTIILPFNSADDSFTISIANNGLLIPEEMKEKIFEPFFRLKETNKQPGTGIGLSLSRSLAQLHHGALTTTIKDKMNVFLLTLPIHQEKQFEWYDDRISQQAAQIPFLTEGVTHNEDKRATILLVEDNLELLAFVAAELDREYRVLKTGNGSEALVLLNHEPVQLLISDIMMPVMNGLELCKAVKSNFEYSHIPVILLTAKNTLQSKIEGLEQGADAYIEKPFSTQHLLAQINSLLTNRNKIKAYFASSPLVHIKTMAYSKEDETFLLSIQDIISRNMDNFDLNVEHLAKIMNMSRPTLYRKIKALSDLTPNELINITRLKKGSELLAEGRYKIYEVADMLGYTLQSNFTRDFTKQFGMSPSEYMHSKKTGEGARSE